MRSMIKRHPHAWAMTSVSFLALAAVPAMAQNMEICCPDDGNGAAPTGLGQAFPQAPNVSLSPAWFVYAFERGGIHYRQVNGPNGKVRAAIAYVGDTFWVPPVGLDPVSTPQQPLKIPAGAARTVVYGSQSFELVAYTTSHSVLWAVELLAQ